MGQNSLQMGQNSLQRGIKESICRFCGAKIQISFQIISFTLIKIVKI